MLYLFRTRDATAVFSTHKVASINGLGDQGSALPVSAQGGEDMGKVGLPEEAMQCCHVVICMAAVV